LLDDTSPLVRGAAVWALGQLLPDQEFAAIKTDATAGEQDESVREEWQGVS
jgi:epoxyqueuosine reductase